MGISWPKGAFLWVLWNKLGLCEKEQFLRIFQNSELWIMSGHDTSRQCPTERVEILGMFHDVSCLLVKWLGWIWMEWYNKNPLNHLVIILQTFSIYLFVCLIIFYCMFGSCCKEIRRWNVKPRNEWVENHPILRTPASFASAGPNVPWTAVGIVVHQSVELVDG